MRTQRQWAFLLVLPLALMYFRFKYHQDVLKSPRGLDGVRERLAAHGDWRSAYFSRLRRSLAWVDSKLGSSAWSADSYEFTLNMAFIYPFASLLIIWVATGQNTSGISGLVPGDAPLWKRALFLFGVSASAFFCYRALTSSGWRAAYANYAVAYAVTYALLFAGAGAFDFAGAFAGTFIFAVFVAFGGAFAFAGAAGVALAGAFAFVFAGALAFASALALAALVIAGIMAKRGLKGLFYIFFVPTTLGLLAVAISNTVWFDFGNKHGRSLFVLIMVFLVLLPLTNSIFDWLSLAATRGLLKGMAERDDTPALQVAGNALAGLFLGVLLAAGLAATATAGLQTMNHLSQSHGGPEFFDLTGTLYRLRTTPADPAVWWVYFTLFSTMLPTVFHAAIASASFVTWRLPDSWKRHWLDDLIGTGDIKDDWPVLVGMAWRLTLMDAATVLLAALSATALAWLLLWLMPLEGGGLLWLCERVAEWLGAPIQM